MNRTTLKNLSFLFLFLLLIRCASYDVKYANGETGLTNSNVTINSPIDYSFYLIGDAGNANLNEPLHHFSNLKSELLSVGNESTVLFLGDNIYEKGLPKLNHPERALAESRINAQLDLVKDFSGQSIFIPGNHDYYSDGIDGVKRQAEYISEILGDKNTFLPKKGCPLKKVELTDDLVLIVVDSQWYLENWDDNPTMNDDCEIKSRENFFDEFESLIKKNATKTIVVAMHHPLFSNGHHGGQFSWKSQLYPANNTIPLPGIGSLINLLRKTSGASPQDLNNALYLKLKNRLVTLAQKSEKIIFVSGHEHNLQYIYKDNIHQIVSGSGSKTAPARPINGGEFTYGGLGYAKLNIYENGASEIVYYKTSDNKTTPIFNKILYDPISITSTQSYSNQFPSSMKASVYTSDEIDKGKSYKGLWGDHYRKYYGTLVEAPVALLDTLMGGLTPIRKGGGNQSKSIRLKNSKGQEFVMRAVKKSATQYLQAVAFKDQYLEGQFDNTYTEDLLMDIYTTAHPYAPLTVGKLADAIDVFHANPQLLFIPKQDALGSFNSEFGDALYILEERVTSGHGNVKSFGFSNKIISTDDLLKELRASDDNTLDEENYIRARLLDMLIGDWDRHEDQWRWAAFENGKKVVYKPVPRDRDQAFSSSDGFMLGLLTRLIPDLKLMQQYTPEMRSVKWFNLEPYPLDITFLQHTGLSSWKNQAEFIQKNITDEVIEAAFNEMPQEVLDETIVKIKLALKGRLKNLSQIAETYYSHLSNYAVVKGNDKDNWFEIERQPKGYTQVKIFNIKDGQKGNLYFDKTFSKSETKEIWVYGLDDKDVFEVKGTSSIIIPLRLIGGQNNDTYSIENGKKVSIYDFKNKKNTFKNSKGRKNLINDYETNTYNFKKIKYSKNTMLPALGSNPDDGLKIGLTSTIDNYGFVRNPFTSQHIISASYYKAHNGFEISYSAEFAKVFRNWNLSIENRFTSPTYSINFFGLGNETLNLEDTYDDDYHRIRISSISSSPSIKWVGNNGGSFAIKGSFESIKVEDTEGRFIGTQDVDLDMNKSFLGFSTVYHFENYDNHGFPTLGMSTNLEAGWRTNLSESSENHSFIIPSLGFNYRLSHNGAVVLATKLKGHILFGDDFEFYNAASIGGQDGLRGFRNQRFSGKRSFYQNTDLRFSLKRVKTGLMPVQIGLFGGFDYGRVWIKDDPSEEWHTSLGGGLWIVGADMFNLNLSVFDSVDGSYFMFGLGFGF